METREVLTIVVSRVERRRLRQSLERRGQVELEEAKRGVDYPKVKQYSLQPSM
jgi:hypothetical protein